MTNFQTPWDWFTREDLIFINSAETILEDKFLYLTNRFQAQTRILRLYDANLKAIQELLIGTNKISYKYLPKAKKVLVADDLSVAPELRPIQYRLLDPISKAIQEISVVAPKGCSVKGEIIRVFKDESAFFDTMTCGSTLKVVEVSLVNGEVHLLGTGSILPFDISENEEWILYSNAATQNKIMALHRPTGVPVQTPIPFSMVGEWNINQVFTRSHVLLTEKKMIGFVPNQATGPLYHIDLQTKQSREICSNIEGEKLYFSRFRKTNLSPKTSSDKIFLFTYDRSKEIYRFYQVRWDENSACPKVNEFPSRFPYPTGLIVTPIGFALSLNGKESVLVPIDGRPPLKLSSPLEGPWQMDISPSKNKIYILGPDSDGKRRLKAFSF